jgi:hypothetical protein
MKYLVYTAAMLGGSMLTLLGEEMYVQGWGALMMLICLAITANTK